MLVLKRKLNESILVGEATITVHRVKGQSVTLTVDAPNHVGIYRTELISEAIRKENEAKNGDF